MRLIDAYILRRVLMPLLAAVGIAMAALLMQRSTEAIDEAIATGDTTWAALPKAVPVFVVYETAFADADGKLQFRADIYSRDAEIWQALDPKRRTVAERKTPDQSGR